MVVKIEALLYYQKSALNQMRGQLSLHLLKLVTGVETSTRAVNRSGRPGKEVKSRSRTAAAAPKMAAFLLSMLMSIEGGSKRVKVNSF